MHAPISVSALNEQIKQLLETTFLQVYVEGELSRITYHSSGHIYFTLKDSGSALSGVMFRGNASRLRFRLEEGLKVVVQGAVTLYKPRGSYQINAFSIEPAGHGALALAFEQLKQKLSAEGLFDPALKKTLPKYPLRIGLVTSATGAALQDMKRVAAQRWPLAELFVYDAVVQGEQAPFSMTEALKAADTAGYDVIVLGRGGGSMEDLWGFNDEGLARAVAAAVTPVVSAVGHEIDWVISDFVADLRAPTPSAAMQMILPDQNEMLMHLDGLTGQYDAVMNERMQFRFQNVAHLYERYRQHSVDQKIKAHLELIGSLRQRFDQGIRYRMDRAKNLLAPLYSGLEQATATALNEKALRLRHTASGLEAQDPKLKTKRGYAQIVKENRPVLLSQLQPGDEVVMMDSENIVYAEVTETGKIGSSGKTP